MKTIKQFNNLRIVLLDNAIYGGLYAVVDDKLQKAKTGLCLDAAVEIFNKLKSKYIIIFVYYFTLE